VISRRAAAALAPTLAGCFDAPPRPEAADDGADDGAGEVDAATDSQERDTPEGEATDTAAAPSCFLRRGTGCAEVAQLALGAAFTCARLVDGSVWCWGARDWGQVGDRVVDGATPAPPTRLELPPARDLVAGDDHACVATVAGDVLCWGRSFEQQVGPSEAGWVAAPTPVAMPAPVVSLAAAARATCALLADGRVACWGARLDGQAPPPATRGGSAGGVEIVAGLPGASGVSAIAAGTWSACAWSSALAPPLGARLVEGRDRVRCWGDGDRGQLGDGGDRAAPEGGVDLPERLDALALGGGRACALAGAAIWCWGDNSEGLAGAPLGVATTAAAVRVAELPAAARQVALGDSASCVLDDAGQVSCWGGAGDGLLGPDASSARITPTAVPGVPLATHLALGRAHACVVGRDDAITCWGRGDGGRVDGAAQSGVVAPTAVVATPEPEGATCRAGEVDVRPGGRHPEEACRVCARDEGFVTCSFGCGDDGACHAARDLAVADERRCAVRDDGAVVCGEGENMTNDPLDLSHSSAARAVALGEARVCVLYDDGVVRCRRDGEAPAVVAEGASAIAAGGEEACALVGGEVRCGAGDTLLPVAGLAAVAAIAVGDGLACALLVDGEAVVCWDDGGAPTPVVMSWVLPVTVLAVGAGHVLAVRDDGRDIVGWGANDLGQVDGAPSEGPRGAGPLPSVSAALQRPLAEVAAGEGTSCARSLSGRVVCWGAQGSEDGRALERLGGATHLAAGGGQSCAVQADRVLWCWSGRDAPARVTSEAAP